MVESAKPKPHPLYGANLPEWHWGTAPDNRTMSDRGSQPCCQRSYGGLLPSLNMGARRPPKPLFEVLPSQQLHCTAHVEPAGLCQGPRPTPLKDQDVTVTIPADALSDLLFSKGNNLTSTHPDVVRTMVHCCLSVFPQETTTTIFIQ